MKCRSNTKLAIVPDELYPKHATAQPGQVIGVHPGCRFGTGF